MGFFGIYKDSPGNYRHNNWIYRDNNEMIMGEQ
jgi:uncharacterized protein YegP (UPF0339 family)